MQLLNKSLHNGALQSTKDCWKKQARKLSKCFTIKQLLEEVFVISRIIKVKVISRNRMLSQITLTETWIILHITITELDMITRDLECP